MFAVRKPKDEGVLSAEVQPCACGTEFTVEH